MRLSPLLRLEPLAEKLMTSALSRLAAASNDVRVFLDHDLKSERISFHPNINTVTYVLAFADFERFLATCGNPVKYIKV